MILLACLLFATVEPEDRVEHGVPTRISIGPGDFGQLPESLPQTRLQLGMRARLLVDTPNLFGAIGMNVDLRATYRIVDRVWVSANLSAFELQQVINASIEPTMMGLGPLTTGIHFAAYRSKRFVLSPYARILWPTSSAYLYARPFGVELGVSDTFDIHRMLSLITGVSLPMVITGLGGRALVSFTPTIAAELAFHPAKWFDLLGGLEARLGTDRAGALEHLAPKFAMRFYPVSGLLIELKGMLPVAGLERIDYVFGGGIGWVFDRPRVNMEPATAPIELPPPTSLPASGPVSMPASGPADAML